MQASGILQKVTIQTLPAAAQECVSKINQVNECADSMIVNTDTPVSCVVNLANCLAGECMDSVGVVREYSLCSMKVVGLASSDSGSRPDFTGFVDRANPTVAECHAFGYDSLNVCLANAEEGDLTLANIATSLEALKGIKTNPKCETLIKLLLGNKPGSNDYSIQQCTGNSLADLDSITDENFRELFTETRAAHLRKDKARDTFGILNSLAPYSTATQVGVSVVTVLLVFSSIFH